jgi:glutathione S-transferase
MTLVLYYHPLASFCHKVLIALYEAGTAFEPRFVDLADPGSSAEMLDRWPVGKFPVLWDAARNQAVPETSIIIEYLDAQYPGPVPLIPRDADAALQARLWDRFFDLYVHAQMQRIVLDTLRPEGARDPHGVAEARAALDLAYHVIEQRMPEGGWAAGEAFSIADCAATPALFYALAVHPWGETHPRTDAYFERLLQRPSVQRVLDEARPYFHMFPYRDRLQARFL